MDITNITFANSVGDGIEVVLSHSTRCRTFCRVSGDHVPCTSTPSMRLPRVWEVFLQKVPFERCNWVGSWDRVRLSGQNLSFGHPFFRHT